MTLSATEAAVPSAQPSRLPSISVVVPAYNSSATLPALMERLQPVLYQVAEDYEVILVNDGSADTSWETIRALASRYSWVRGLNLMRNYGQHNALLCGIRAARYDLIVTMDDDLQHPPEEIPALLHKLREGYDVVYGTPRTLPHSWWRNVSSKWTKAALARAMNVPNVRELSAFRVFRTELRGAFTHYQGSTLLLDVLLSWATTRFASVAVDHHPRLVGKSNYTLLKLFNQTMLMLTGYSTAPLRLASLVGFGFTGLGLFLFSYVIAHYLLHGSLPGFPFIASTISLFGGAQLFALGIMGEYLARIFNRSMDRPTYIIRSATPSCGSEPCDGNGYQTREIDQFARGEL